MPGTDALNGATAEQAGDRQAEGVAAVRTEAPTAPSKKAEKELLCTICGLKACWTPPAPTEGAATT